jgi:hypothetical protein
MECLLFGFSGFDATADDAVNPDLHDPPFVLFLTESEETQKVTSVQSIPGAPKRYPAHNAFAAKGSTRRAKDQR